MSDENNNANRDLNALLSQLDLSQLIASGTGIVKRAADILEINVAQGVMAAQKLERKVLDVDQIRAEDEAATIQRFRKNAHEALDILFDTIAFATKSLKTVTDKLEEVTASKGQNAEGAQAAPKQIPTLQPESPLQPGASTEIALMLSNDHGEEAISVSFSPLQLTSASGDAILSRNISFEPSPLKLAPNARDKVTIHVRVPKATKPGTYSGILQSADLPAVRALIMVEVVKDG